MKSKPLFFIFIFSILGILLSGYSLYHHYSTSKGICDINEKLSCDVVNRSIYSEIFGIPVALIGILGYLCLALVSYIMIKNNSNDFKDLLFLSSLLGLLFSAYLTYVEAFKLYTFCPLCLGSAFIIIIIFICSILIRKR